LYDGSGNGNLGRSEGGEKLDRSNEPIASPGQRLDKARVGGGIVQDIAELIQRRPDAVIEIGEGAVRPKGRANLLARDQFAVPLQQRNEEEVRLSLEFQADASLPKLAGVKVDLEHPEPHKAR